MIGLKTGFQVIGSGVGFLAEKSRPADQIF
jgi:hypothetical protein